MYDSATWGEHFDARQRAALELADAMSGDSSNDLDGALIERLQDMFDEVELAELILVAGQANLNNRAGNAAKQLLGPDPAVERRGGARSDREH